MSSTEEILSFNIVIDAVLSEETKKNLEELKSVKEAPGGAPQDLAGELLEAEGEFTPEQLAQIESTIGDTLGGLDKADLAQFGLMAKNPTGFIGAALSRALGAAGGTAILGPLAIAITAPIVLKEIIKALSVKGGPFNRDWRRFIQAEVEIGLSRVQQKEKELGITQTILTQVQGFKPNNENWTYNSLFDVNDARIARIGLSDREAGVTLFLG